MWEANEFQSRTRSPAFSLNDSAFEHWTLVVGVGRWTSAFSCFLPIDIAAP